MKRALYLGEIKPQFRDTVTLLTKTGFLVDYASNLDEILTAVVAKPHDLYVIGSERISVEKGSEETVLWPDLWVAFDAQKIDPKNAFVFLSENEDWRPVCKDMKVDFANPSNFRELEKYFALHYNFY